MSSCIANVDDYWTVPCLNFTIGLIKLDFLSRLLMGFLYFASFCFIGVFCNKIILLVFFVGFTLWVFCTSFVYLSSFADCILL